MFGSNILEVAMGIIVIFILTSTICTAIREGIEARLKTRAAYLEQGIRQLLNDPKGEGIVSHIYNHPSIYGLFNSTYKPGTNTESPDMLAKGGNLPSYIPAKSFAVALMDLAARGPVTDNAIATTDTPIVSLESIRLNVAKINNPHVQRVVLNAIDTAQGDLNKAQASLEAWYDSSMDRVSGWYKRSTQWIILIISVAVTVSLNINTITITNYLSTNDSARAMVVARATAISKDTTHFIKSDSTANAELAKLNLPIGWQSYTSFMINPDKPFGAWNGIFGPLLGWLITALAATLGAPFWFDILNKVMVIRSTVKPNEKSGEEGSKDTSTPQIVYAVSPAPQQQAANVQAEPKEVDGCDVVATQLTADDELPESKGGIA